MNTPASPSTQMLNRDFKEFAGLLNAHGVDATCWWAAMRWPRMGIRATPATSTSGCAPTQNIERLLLSLQAFGFASLGLTAADFGPDTVVQLGQPPRRIDLLTAIDGVEFESLLGTS